MNAQPPGDLAPPAPPFEDWPVQLADPRFGYAWYTAPGVFVCQVHASHGTVEVADAVHDAIDEVIAKRRADFDRFGGVLMIHDWRLMRGYDTAARQTYLARKKVREPGYLRHVVAVVHNSPLMRMAVQTANLVMALRTGGNMTLANDPAEALAKYQVEKPTTTDWLQGS